MNSGQALSIILWTASTLCSAQSITIRVYDYAGLPATDWTKSAEDASLILAKIGYSANWLVCRGADARPDANSKCETELGPTDYVVRILAGERHPAPGIKRALAYSQLEGNAGRYTTLFLDAIQAHAAELTVSQRILLAYVTSHEIIHLLRGPAHSRTGMMKEYWTRNDALAIKQINLAMR